MSEDLPPVTFGIKVTEEMVTAADDAYMDGLTHEAGVRASILAVAPLIAAQALRDAAKHLDDAAAGATEMAKREGTRAELAYAGGLYAAAARLGVRAGELLADECGQPYRVIIPDMP